MIVTLNTRDPFHVAYADGLNHVIVNRDDTTNQILVGPDKGSLIQGDPATFLLDPLGSVTVDGSQDYWAIAVTGTPDCGVLDGGTNWAPSPAQMATQIAASGLMLDTTGQAIHTTTATTATNTTGVAKDTTVNTVATNTTGVAKDTTVKNQTATGLTIAQDIFSTGAPGAAKSTLIAQATTAVLVAGTTVSYPSASTVYSIQQLAYEIIINPVMQAAGIGFIRVTLNWFDSNTTLQVAQKTYHFNAAQAPNGHPVVLTGPCRGDQLQIVILAPSENQATVQVQFSALQNSKYMPRDVARSVANIGTSGYTIAGFDPDAGILASAAPTIAATTDAARLLAFYTGTVRIAVNTASLTSDCTVQIWPSERALVSPNFPPNNGAMTFYSAKTNSQGFLFDEVQLPHFQCEIDILNGNAASKQINFIVTIDEGSE